MALPHVLLESESFIGLSGAATRLLLQVAAQYNGTNNGALSASYKVLKEKGFRSKRGISDALDELQEAGLLIKTREGRFNPRVTALYAITWRSIDECPGMNLAQGPTNSPPRKFSMEGTNVRYLHG